MKNEVKKNWGRNHEQKFTEVAKKKIFLNN